jgi:hypothetical protein
MDRRAKLLGLYDRASEPALTSLPVKITTRRVTVGPDGEIAPVTRSDPLDALEGWPSPSSGWVNMRLRWRRDSVDQDVIRGERPMMGWRENRFRSSESPATHNGV